MKKIKDLTIKVTYIVELDNVEVSDKVYDALAQCYYNGGNVSPDGMTNEESIAAGWLNDNIRESDAMEWEYDINDFRE